MDTALVKKLGMKPSQRALLIAVPQNVAARLTEPMEGYTFDATSEGSYDIILGFVSSRAELAERFPLAAQALKADGKLWLAYPKRSSGMHIDLDRDHGWDAVHAQGWEGVSLIAIDEIWSAMRLRHTSAIQRTPERPVEQAQP